MFQCPHASFKEKRTSELTRVLGKIGKHTDKEIVSIFRAGILSITDGYDMSDYSREFLSRSDHTAAVQAQSAIGWEHFLYG